MDKSEWGASAWKFLHCCTFAQKKHPSQKQQQRLKQFFELLPYVLPCSICSTHYREYTEQHPIDTTTRDSICKWLIDLHNNVNVITDNPFVRHMSYEDVYRIYSYNNVENENNVNEDDELSTNVRRAAGHTRNTKIMFGVVIGIVLLLIIVVCIVCMVYSCHTGRCPVVVV